MYSKICVEFFLVWRKLIYFWRRYKQKTVFTFSLPVTSNLILIATLVHRCISTKLEALEEGDRCFLTEVVICRSLVVKTRVARPRPRPVVSRPRPRPRPASSRPTPSRPRPRPRPPKKQSRKTHTRIELKTIASKNVSFQALLIVTNITAEVGINMWYKKNFNSWKRYF